MPQPDLPLEFQFDRRFAELETRLAFHEHTLAEMSDALASARDENARTQELLRRALEDLKTLRTLLYSDPTYSDPASEPPPPHY
jgi:SlyX protein